MLFESCVDSVDAAVASAAGGAGRVELCADLDIGGTTPDPDLVARCVAAAGIPVVAMVRPRGGDFVYDANELHGMARAVRDVRAAGAHGIATGAIGRDAAIDRDAMRRLIDAAWPLPVTCHRAFDVAPDLDAALETLLALGVARVLTSGGAATAALGAETIARLAAAAGGALVVVAAGTVRAHNVADLVARTRVREVHARIAAGDAPAGADRPAAWRDAVAAFVARMHGA